MKPCTLFNDYNIIYINYFITSFKDYGIRKTIKDTI